MELRPPQSDEPGTVPPGEVIRRARRTQGMSLVKLGTLTGYSASQLSRLERGASALTDITVLARFARALAIPPQALGLAPTPSTSADDWHSRRTHSASRPPAPTLGPEPEDGEDAMRRRTVLSGLAATAAAAMGAPVTGAGPADLSGPQVADRITAGLRDAMLGLGPPVPEQPLAHLAAELRRATEAFDACAYSRLAIRLPCLLQAGHQATSPSHRLVLAQSYLLATRVLIKMDAPELSWLAADRAQQHAASAGAPLVVAEAARQRAVLARKAGWHDQAVTLALTAADDSALRDAGPLGTAQRGLLLQCAAYTVAHQRDRTGMRELTAEAAAIAHTLGPGARLRDTSSGGFTPATVQLHLISAETAAGDPSTAIAAADALPPQLLPTAERRSMYFTDRARAYAQWGRRDDCIKSLLQAERQAPEETHSRPAVRALVSGLLLSGRTTPDLRGLAARAGALGG
ncbi:helix-turn-helix transcriptional regulator [Streptomyces sp. NPDC048717]|uniref:helix-turn-helix transcriptional regulator n=1 Tax=Streptomyces sp. NPDC048717 TaxID=3154928 RepID=UPI00342EAE72